MISPTLANEYPGWRAWPWPLLINGKDHPAVMRAREWSSEQLQQMEKCLQGRVTGQVAMVAASGSLGRLDACELSDCDLIVVLKEGVDLESREAAMAMDSVWDALALMQLPRPKPTGIYATPTTRGKLGDRGTLGVIAEDRAVFGKRFQLLLDSQPVYGRGAFEETISGIVDRAASGFVEHDSAKQWVYLLNDLTRYFRSFCLWRQMDFTRDHEGWYVRNAKLRHSRVLMYAGLLFLLAESSTESKDKPAWLKKHLRLTAMERVALAFERRGDRGFEKIARAYDVFLARFGDADFRGRLVAAAPAGLEEMSSKRCPEYDELHANSAVIMTELTRFVLARQGEWSPAFFEFLLF